MRKLEAADLFKMARVVNAIGIKEQIKEIAMEANSTKDLINQKSELGFELLFGIFERATQEKAESKLFEFCADLFEMPVEEVQHMDPVEFIGLIFEAADVEKWKAFFSRLAKLIMKSN